MNQPLDHMVARSMAHERERDLRMDLRQREAEAARHQPAAPVRHAWLHDALVRLHLAHAPTPLT